MDSETHPGPAYGEYRQLRLTRRITLNIKTTGSRLLINTPPLQVLKPLAVKYGLMEAVILQQIHFRLGGEWNVKEFEGRMWVRCTLANWLERDFPWLSMMTLRRIMSDLENQGLILRTKALNADTGDQSYWYSLNYSKLGCEEAEAIVQTEHMCLGRTEPVETAQEDDSDACVLDERGSTVQNEQLILIENEKESDSSGTTSVVPLGPRQKVFGNSKARKSLCSPKPHTLKIAESASRVAYGPRSVFEAMIMKALPGKHMTDNQRDQLKVPVPTDQGILPSPQDMWDAPDPDERDLFREWGRKKVEFMRISNMAAVPGRKKGTQWAINSIRSYAGPHGWLEHLEAAQKKQTAKDYCNDEYYQNAKKLLVVDDEE
jgi:hypothetical protein